LRQEQENMALIKRQNHQVFSLFHQNQTEPKLYQMRIRYGTIEDYDPSILLQHVQSKFLSESISQIGGEEVFNM